MDLGSLLGKSCGRSSSVSAVDNLFYQPNARLQYCWTQKTASSHMFFMFSWGIKPNRFCSRQFHAEVPSAKIKEFFSKYAGHCFVKGGATIFDISLVRPKMQIQSGPVWRNWLLVVVSARIWPFFPYLKYWWFQFSFCKILIRFPGVVQRIIIMLVDVLRGSSHVPDEPLPRTSVESSG